MMECSAQLAFGFHPQLPIRVDFDAPEISSDAGALLLRPLDDRLGVSAGFAACLVDDRDPRRVLHDRHEQTPRTSTPSKKHDASLHHPDTPGS